MVTPRDEEILAHIGLYRITIREAVSAAFGLRNPGTVLQRLRADGLVIQHDGLPGKVSYYQLTARGACDRVPLERARPLGPPALRQHLAILWFAHLTERPRRRLEECNVRELFGSDGPSARQVGYCVETDGDARRLLRIHVPGESVPAARVVKALRELIVDLEQRGAEVRSWLLARSLGIAVLADTPERTTILRSALATSGLSSRVHVSVHAAATPRTLTSFLNTCR